MLERRQMLAACSHVCISVEGGPGTADEMHHAVRGGKIVLPISRTGGASSGMFNAPKIMKPECVDPKDWDLLSSTTVTADETADAVLRILLALQPLIVN